MQVKPTLAIACSGGIDSLALAVIAHETQEIIALIVNHNLRPEAKAEAKKAAEILTKFGIENQILTYTGKPPQKNVQEEARKIRYKLLTDYCKKHGIETLATAHHADDNAENFLLRLARGSGIDGLSAMPESTTINGVKIIRPMLQFTKLQIAELLKQRKIKWVEDATNKTDKYKRNALRHALEKLEDADLITKRINDASQTIARVRGYLQEQTQKALKTCYSDENLDQKKLAKLHPEIAFRVMNALIERRSPKAKKPRAEEVLRLLEAIKLSEKRTLAGLIFTPKNGKITIALEK